MKKEAVLPIYLDIEVEDAEDLEPTLDKVLVSPQFKQIMKTLVVEILKDAITENREQVALFRLPVYGIDYIIEKNQYKNLLNKVLDIFQTEEDYLSCVEIKNLIDAI